MAVKYPYTRVSGAEMNHSIFSTWYNYSVLANSLARYLEGWFLPGGIATKLVIADNITIGSFEESIGPVVRAVSNIHDLKVMSMQMKRMTETLSFYHILSDLTDYKTNCLVE